MPPSDDARPPRPAKTDDETRAAPSSGEVARIRAATVEVVAGPDKGRTARLDGGIVAALVMGKGDSCDLRLTDGTVSRVHAKLTLSPQGVIVSDEGSKNGTFVNGMQIGRVILTSDATITLGATTVRAIVDARETEIELSTSERFGDAFGRSAAMRSLFATLERAAPSDAPILVEGESGVGKEVLVRAVHEASRRKKGPFVAIDCGAIPAQLVESELFGHERGAFTGADRARDGVFQQAHGGTLFLDEIGELPIDLQPKLLRALETGEVRPVGGRPLKVDVRVLSATNRRLGEAVHRGEFRIDLFYRLAVVRVVVPPLRDRREDILPLATELFRRTSGHPAIDLPSDFTALLTSHAWPGNVRELRNVIDRYALLGTTNPRQLFDAGFAPSDDRAGAALFDEPFHDARQKLLDRFERDYVEHALEACGGIVAKAVERTRIPRPTFYRMLTRLGLGRRGGGDE
jgi:DNA-binding NtrC family response regulator